MADDSKREEVIEGIMDVLHPQGLWNIMQEEHHRSTRVKAEAILTVFEKAQNPRIDDEREALDRDVLNTLRKLMDHLRFSRNDLPDYWEACNRYGRFAQAMKARRSEEPEPQGAPVDGTSKPLTINSQGEWVNEIGDTGCPNDGEFTNKRCWMCGWLRATGPIAEVPEPQGAGVDPKWDKYGGLPDYAVEDEPEPRGEQQKLAKQLIEDAVWALINDSTDVVDRGVSQELYDDAWKTVSLVWNVIKPLTIMPATALESLANDLDEPSILWHGRSEIPRGELVEMMRRTATAAVTGQEEKR